MKWFFRHLWIVASLAAVFSATACSFLPIPSVRGAGNTIMTDFSVGMDYPLVKTKFNLFNTFKRTLPDFKRDASLLRELGVENMRADFEFGEPYGQDTNAVGGTASNLTYDLSLIDQESHIMLQNGVIPGTTLIPRILYRQSPPRVV